MKKLDLGQAIQIVANLGVVAGIVFLAIEVQQATNAVKSSTLQAIAQQSYETSMTIAQSADLRAVQRAARGGQDVSEDQGDQLDALYLALIRLQQNRFQQLRLGVLDDDTVFEVGGTGPGYRTPYFREFWSERRSQYSEEFQDFMDQRVLTESAERL